MQILFVLRLLQRRRLETPYARSWPRTWRWTWFSWRTRIARRRRRQRQACRDRRERRTSGQAASRRRSDQKAPHHQGGSGTHGAREARAGKGSAGPHWDEWRRGSELYRFYGRPAEISGCTNRPGCDTGCLILFASPTLCVATILSLLLVTCQTLVTAALLSLCRFYTVSLLHARSTPLVMNACFHNHYSISDGSS